MTTQTEWATESLTTSALAASADRVGQAAMAMARPHRVDEDLTVAWHGDRGFFTNLALVTTTAPDWPDVLARVSAVVPRDRDVSLIAAGPVPDLTPYGWRTLVGHPPLMVRAPGALPDSLPAGLEIADVVDEAGLEAFERTLIEHYPDPLLLSYRWGDLNDGRVLGRRTRFLLGLVDGRPVGTATSHLAAGVNLVEMIAVAPEHRGRGYGAALTAAAIAVAPDQPTVLIASDLGRGVYERLGFEIVDRWTFWHR